LQEVRDWNAANELVSVIPDLKVAIVSRFNGDQQQVIASRLPIDSAWAEPWKSSAVTDLPRGYSFAALQMPDGAFLLVYSLHMKANGRGGDEVNIAKREESSRQLIAHVADMQKLYSQRGKVAIILAGDWNTTLDLDPRFNAETTLRGPLASGFHSSWENVPFEQRITHPGADGWPPITFDHILTAGLGNPTGRVENIPNVSDHMPAIVEFSSVPGAAPIVVGPPISNPQPAEAAPPQAEAQPAAGSDVASETAERSGSALSVSVEDGTAPLPIRDIKVGTPNFQIVPPGAKSKPSPESNSETADP
jgi:endonuclease/exonuclease/phosphatase family metal-dependent hydrolase